MKDLDYERLFNPRKAKCGACGAEWSVDGLLRRDRAYKYKRRPDKEHDDFYCGCQDDEHDLFWEE